MSHKTLSHKTILLHLSDLLWSCVIITPLAVLGWRGMWDLLDQVISISKFSSFLMFFSLSFFQVFPNDPESYNGNLEEVFTAEISPWSALASYVTGLLCKIMLDLCREKTGEYLSESKKIVKYTIGWSIRIIQGVAMVAYWRGTFGLLSNNIGEGVLPVCLVLVTSSLLLATVKVSKCGIFPPLVLITDSHDQTFQNGLYFRSSPGEQGFLLLDCIFSNFVIKIVPILAWWSLWCLENKYFSHNVIGEKDEVISYDSLISGYALVMITFMADKLLPYEQFHKVVSRFSKLFITFLSIVATLNVWRGVWSWFDHCFFPFIPGTSNYVLGLLVSIVGLTITLSTNTLGGDSINFDDEDMAVIDIQYWSLVDDTLDNEETEPICGAK